eukprot:557160-Prymnesium_polylepis.1
MAPSGETTVGLANPSAEKLPISPPIRSSIAAQNGRYSLLSGRVAAAMAARSLATAFCSVMPPAMHRLPSVASTSPRTKSTAGGLCGWLWGIVTCSVWLWRPRLNHPINITETTLSRMKDAMQQ